jgi:hypothetical protein
VKRHRWRSGFLRGKEKEQATAKTLYRLWRGRGGEADFSAALLTEA